MGIFRFIKRQFSTKTGKLGLGLIIGALTDSVLPPGIGGVVRDMAGNLLGAETATLGLAAMFLRDKEAKKENGD